MGMAPGKFYFLVFSTSNWYFYLFLGAYLLQWWQMTASGTWKVSKMY